MVRAVRSKSEKTCDMCGGIGLPKETVTCCKCKIVSQHIYCMITHVLKAPEVWFCEDCIVVDQSQGVEVQDACTQLKIAEPARTATEVKRKFPVDQLGSPKKEREVTDSPPRKDTVQSPIRNTSFKMVENAKVKFISAQEVAKLTSGGKVYEKMSGSGTSSQAPFKSPPSVQKTSQESHQIPKSPPNLKRTTTYVSALARPRTAKTNASVEKISTSLINETPTRGLGAELHVSSLKDRNLAAVKLDSAALPMNKNDQKRKRTTGYSSGHDHRNDENPPSKSVRCKEAKCVDSGLPHTADNKVSIAIGKPAEQAPDLTKAQRNHNSDVTSPQAHVTDNKSGASHDEIPSNELVTSGSGSDFRTDAQCQGHICWKGNFEVFDIASHVYNGIQAHLSVKASHKASEVSKQMPEELKFKMVPRKAVWPKIFQLDSPNKDDIGLYFVPRDEERPREMYDLLLKWVDSHDFAMQSRVNDVELLIFTSNQLADKSQKIDPQVYLWGIFRKVTQKKSSQRVPGHLLLDSAGAAMANNNCNPYILVEGNSEDVDMEVDMVGGAEVGRIDKPIPRLGTPTTFVKFPLKKVVRTAVPDTPGYSRPPSPLKNVGSTAVQVTPGFSRPPSPVKVCSTDVLDTPPGFSRPPSLLKNLGRTVVLDTPPGFSRPPSHLKNIGSTAVLDTPPGFSRPPSPFKYPLKKEGSIGLLDGPPGFSGPANYRHGITPLNTTPTSGLARRSTTGGYVQKLPEASVLQSRCPQVASIQENSTMHVSSNPSMLSPDWKEGVSPTLRPSFTNGYLHQAKQVASVNDKSANHDSSKFSMRSPDGKKGVSPTVKHDSSTSSKLSPDGKKGTSPIDRLNSANRRDQHQAETKPQLVVITHEQSAKHQGSKSNLLPDGKEGAIPVHRSISTNEYLHQAEKEKRAYHDSSNSSMRSPDGKKGVSPTGSNSSMLSPEGKKGTSPIETEPRLLSTNVLSPSSTDKWLRVETLLERKNEIKKKLAAVNEKTSPSSIDKLPPANALLERKKEIKRKLAAINEKTPWLSVSIKTEL